MALRQLAERNQDGIVVQLFWNDSGAPGGSVRVEYLDELQGVFFTLSPSLDRALDAFYHPNAYWAAAARESSLRAAA